MPVTTGNYDSRHLASNPGLFVEALVSQLRANPFVWARAPEQVTRFFRDLEASNVRCSAALLERCRRDALLRDGDAPVSADGLRPGVVALLIDRGKWPDGRARHRRVGLVQRLLAERSRDGRWEVASNLPFSASQLRAFVGELFAATGLLRDRLPERVAFRLSLPTGQRIEGGSMNVASVLALVDAASGNEHRCLAKACAVVKPWEHGALAAVQDGALKLEAFRRELGRGSLLVRHADDAETARFDDGFDAVWPVRSWSDLARALEREELLAPFLSMAPLTRAETLALNGRFDQLLDVARAHDDAAALQRRMWACGFEPGVQLGERLRSLRGAAGAWSRTGHPARAEALGRRVVAEIDAVRKVSPRLVMRDEWVRAQAALGLYLFDLYRFDEVIAGLGPLWAMAQREPDVLSPDTQASLGNTLCRAWDVTGTGDWEAGLRATLAVMRAEPSLDVERTWGYLVHGLLKRGRLDEASRELRTIGRNAQRFSPFAMTFVGWQEADLARRQGRLATVPGLELQLANPAARWSVHPLAYYAQATARQPGRSRGDAVGRMTLALEILRKETPDPTTDSVAHFTIVTLELVRAGYEGDVKAWEAATEALSAALDEPQAAAARTHYQGVRGLLSGGPSVPAAEAWVEAVPFL